MKKKIINFLFFTKEQRHCLEEERWFRFFKIIIASLLLVVVSWGFLGTFVAIQQSSDNYNRTGKIICSSSDRWYSTPRFRYQYSLPECDNGSGAEIKGSFKTEMIPVLIILPFVSAFAGGLLVLFTLSVLVRVGIYIWYPKEYFK